VEISDYNIEKIVRNWDKLANVKLPKKMRQVTSEDIAKLNLHD